MTNREYLFIQKTIKRYPRSLERIRKNIKITKSQKPHGQVIYKTIKENERIHKRFKDNKTAPPYEIEHMYDNKRKTHIKVMPLSTQKMNN